MVKSKKPAKELTVFFWLSIACFGVAILLPFFAVAAVLFGARALMLTFDSRIKGEHYITRQRAILGVLVLASVWLLTTK